MNNFSNDYRNMMKVLGQLVAFIATILVGIIILYVIGTMVFALLHVGFYVFFGIAVVLFAGLIVFVLTVGKRILEFFDK